MALPTLLDFEAVAGTDNVIPFQVADEDGNPRDITGWSVTCRVAYSEAADAERVFQKSTSDGTVSITSASTGEGEVLVDAADIDGFGQRELPMEIITVDLGGDTQVTAAGALSLSSRIP